MKKSEKVLVVFCLLFFLTNLISLSRKQQISKDPIPVQPDQGMIICDDTSVDQSPPLSPHWRSRHSRKYCGMVVGDYDSDGYDEVAFDFGLQGIWIYDPNAATKWNKISNDDPIWMIAIAISSTSDDELLVEWDSLVNGVYNSWWNYSGATGYPGKWYGISGDIIDYTYDAGDINADGDSEVVAQWDGYGVYVCNFTGSGGYGGFDIYKISTTAASGFTVKFADQYYELLHSFSDGTKFWNYAAGYPSSNWTTINSAYFDFYDSVAADVDGDTNTTDELMVDILGQLWLYDYDDGSWTRYNYYSACDMYAVAYNILNEQYEFLVRFCAVPGLWTIDPGYSWKRASWNQPQFILGANFRTYANGGNAGEEAIADFGTGGVWYQTTYAGGWTRINWNDPDAMIKANLDADPEMEIVFDFGSTGVFIWDGATGSGTWTRINWGNPEPYAPFDQGCAECEK